MTDEQINDLGGDLQQQRDPKNGQPLIDAIYTNEVNGTGPYALREPHLLLLPNDGITFRVEQGNEQLWEDIGKSFGSHHKHGVLYDYGGPLKRGIKAPDAELYDVVPTVLRGMGLPLPHVFDGRVLDEMFREEKQPSRAAEAAADSRLAYNKLRKLLEVSRRKE